MSNYLIKLKFLFVGFVLMAINSGCGLTDGLVSNQNQSPTPSPTASPVSNPSRTDVFKERLAEFTKLPAKVQLTDKPYLKGKIVVYEKKTKIGDKTSSWAKTTDFGWNGYDFDEKFKDIYAKTSEDMQTVVLNSCQQTKSGFYEIKDINGDNKRTVPGFGWKCEITLIDRTIPAVSYRKTFESETEFIPVYGKNIQKIEEQQPTVKIENFLGDLPRR